MPQLNQLRVFPPSLRTNAVILAATTFLLLAGCATETRTADVAVRAGMSRVDLRAYFGEPLRIERNPSGGEDWYYRFIAWKTRPVGESGTREEFGERTSYVSVGLEFSRPIEERPVHVCAEGFVIGPVPTGKVVKN
jgi:hypothetical protein